MQLPLGLRFSEADAELALHAAAELVDDRVSATQTRNFVMGDPLLDWLDLYGVPHGFRKDTYLPGYDPRLDFGRFIMEQDRRFETAVVDLLRARSPLLQIGYGASLERRAAETRAALMRGTPIVYQGVLLDDANRISGIPDLLVRSDVLAKLFPVSPTLDDASSPTLSIGGERWHYRVVDIKFRMLGL